MAVVLHRTDILNIDKNMSASTLRLTRASYATIVGKGICFLNMWIHNYKVSRAEVKLESIFEMSREFLQKPCKCCHTSARRRLWYQ